MGHRIDATGIHPTENKVHAISEAPTPANITQTESFCWFNELLCKIYPTGCCPHGSFIQTISERTQVGLTERCDSASQTCKEMHTSEAVLVHYDSTRTHIKLACDASLYGLWAVLSYIFEDG